MESFQIDGKIVIVPVFQNKTQTML